MAEVRLLDKAERRVGDRHQEGALDLARRMPALVVAAKEVASSVMHGVHGRRRAGIGETFWQFRPFVTGESANRIDWRRSARDDRLYVREREWEAAHTVWLWMDRSASMAFSSKLAREPKVDRALTLGLAAADLLVRGGERVGLLDLTPARASRMIVEQMAAALIADERRDATPAELPTAIPLAARTRAVLIGDFLTDVGTLAEAIGIMASRGARGHLVMIADPVEEAFPFHGHTEFLDVDSPATLRMGKAEAFRADYLARLSRHRAAVADAAASRGWTCMIHRTDRPASQALLALRARLEIGAAVSA